MSCAVINLLQTIVEQLSGSIRLVILELSTKDFAVFEE